MALGRHSVPEIRAPARSPREPAHLPMCLCKGSRTNQAAPKATLLRHPPARPTGDENRTQPWTKTHNQPTGLQACDTTSREWSRLSNSPGAAV